MTDKKPLKSIFILHEVNLTERQLFPFWKQFNMRSLTNFDKQVKALEKKLKKLDRDKA